jgi:hypothetical protein
VVDSVGEMEIELVEGLAEELAEALGPEHSDK